MQIKIKLKKLILLKHFKFQDYRKDQNPNTEKKTMDMDMKIYSVKIDKVIYSLNNRAKGNLFTYKKIIIIMKIINKIKKQRIHKRIKS